MNVLLSLSAVLVLVFISYAGITSANLTFLFGAVIPYTFSVLFVGGILYRVIKWAKSPVPFRITTTTGQQKSLDWIPSENLENPHNLPGVIGRMLLEILFFRSLFRNSRVELWDGPRLAYGSSKWLWIGAMAFHWSFLIILVRHLRFFTEPVPSLIVYLQKFDGLFEVGVPVYYITTIIILISLSYLLIRRLYSPQVRYISLAADYFPLFLLLGVTITGFLMRHFIKTDIVAAKKLMMSLLFFAPQVPRELGVIFYIHLFLVCCLFAYLPFSKLAHMAGVFMSPTRNLANTNRMKRHENPWNPTVKVHTYEEWEDEFRDKLKSAHYPLERE